jgi:hypothetical protein
MAFAMSAKLTGTTTEDLEFGLEEVQRLTRAGYSAGKGNNDSGGYEFSIEGEEDPPADEEGED